jgi:hypothetical protein
MIDDFFDNYDNFSSTNNIFYTDCFNLIVTMDRIHKDDPKLHQSIAKFK